MADEPSTGELGRRIDRLERDIPQWIAAAVDPVKEDVREIKDEARERRGSATMRVVGIIGAVVGIATVLIASLALAHGGG